MNGYSTTFVAALALALLPLPTEAQRRGGGPRGWDGPGAAAGVERALTMKQGLELDEGQERGADGRAGRFLDAASP